MVDAVSRVGSVMSTTGISPLTRIASAMSGNHSGLDKVTPVAASKMVATRPASPVEYTLPTQREGADPVEMAVRSRITPFEPVTATEESSAIPFHSAREKGVASNVAVETQVGRLQVEGGQPPNSSLVGGSGRINANGEYVQGLTKSSETAQDTGECETCNNRKYVDGSDDGSVSFQTPTHIPPEQAASKVMAHEQEHVVNEQLYAKREGREVISQNVQIFQDICPDCGASYVSGGLTTTVTAKEEQTQQPNTEASTSNTVDIVA